MIKEVGRIEKISFLDLNHDVDAKVDTGAWRTSLHVDNISLKDDKLVFKIGRKKFVYDKFKIVKVKNSFGIVQNRYSIKTKIKLGDRIYNISVSLSNREDMKYPCLIGRRFLYRNKYLVDVNKKFVNDTDKKM